MRKWFLLVLTGFFLTAGRAQVMLGIKGGVNISTINSYNYGNLSWKANVHAGALVSLPIYRQFSLQPEIMYSGQGTRSTENHVGSNLNIDYLNIPILLKYKHPSGFFVESGPQIGKLLNAKFLLPNYNEDMKSLYRKFDFSWAFGLGYLIKDLNLGFDARYNLGITNFFQDTYAGSGENNVVQVGVFFIFGVKAAKHDDGL
ncbi:MAG: porin family protein [Bacteroidota bacterium]|nr:porin family protein [Bacteroidota bacterium]MDP4211062.1 porin family protein [Bacteroidota bacterium]MDP4249203.1 porin family protein [Bacteroidota bacterium]